MKEFLQSLGLWLGQDEVEISRLEEIFPEPVPEADILKDLPSLGPDHDLQITMIKRAYPPVWNCPDPSYNRIALYKMLKYFRGPNKKTSWVKDQEVKRGAYVENKRRNEDGESAPVASKLAIV